jgi:hypothetical protein
MTYLTNKSSFKNIKTKEKLIEVVNTIAKELINEKPNKVITLEEFTLVFKMQTYSFLEQTMRKIGLSTKPKTFINKIPGLKCYTSQRQVIITLDS